MSTQALQFAQLAGITAPVYAARQSTAAQRPVARVAASPAPSAEDRQGFRAGVQQERARWTAVLASKSFAGNPAVAAHLLANTSMSAGEITASLRQIAADTAAAPREQAAAIAERWNAAFRRMEAATGDAPRPSREIAGRWAAAVKRAGVA
jgi:hypothetical protein